MTYPTTLEDLKVWRKKGLSAECGRAISQGFEHGLYKFDCEVTDQLNYNSMLHLAAADDSNTVDCDVDLIETGERLTIQMTRSEILSMSQVAAAHVYGLRARLKTAKAAVDAAETTEAVNEVRF